MDVSRVRFLGAGSALAAFGPALLTPFVAAAAEADEGDVKTLNVLAAFERAAIKAYQAGAGTGLLSPGVLTVAKGFLADHTAHRDALVAAIKDRHDEGRLSRTQDAGRRLEIRRRARTRRGHSLPRRHPHVQGSGPRAPDGLDPLDRNHARYDASRGTPGANGVQAVRLLIYGSRAAKSIAAPRTQLDFSPRVLD